MFRENIVSPEVKNIDRELIMKNSDFINFNTDNITSV